jgi:cyclopropane-fatty-acyl-phospholipid synthase
MIETATRTAPSAPVESTLAFLRDLFSDFPRDFAVRFWDGSVWQPDDGREPRFTIVLRHPGSVRAMFWPPRELTLSEAYIYDDFDIEGEIEAVFELADHFLAREPGLSERLRLMRRVLTLPSEQRPRVGRGPAQLGGRRTSLERARQAIAYHYDVSNDFFELWLDPTMAYSCAVFESAAEDLDTAQLRKLDYVCRKLRLRPGDRLLDIGCGWGALVLHAVRHFGVEAVGVTLSREQAKLCSIRIREAGLEDRCRVELRDYREVDKHESFDKLVSVGMYEHVPHVALVDYFGHAWRLLKPGGVFLAHGIASSIAIPTHTGPTFFASYVFPDHDVVPISTVLTAAEKSRLEVRDVESLREHYALTTRRWRERLEARHDDARRVTSESVYRVWRLMLAGAEHRFARGHASVYQTLLAKPDGGDAGLPLSRADWYA